MNANNNQTESATGISDAVSSPSTSDKAKMTPQRPVPRLWSNRSTLNAVN